MPRPMLLRLWQLAVVALAAVSSVWAAAVVSPGSWAITLFLAGLVAVASVLQTERSGSSIGFDSAVIFGATIVLHEPLAIVFIAFAGGVLASFLQAAVNRKWTLDILAYPAERALSVGFVAFLYSSAVARDAAPMAKVSGAALLIVGYLLLVLTIASLRRQLEGDSGPIDFRRVLRAEGRILLLVIPVIVSEVLLFTHYGAWGFGIGFLLVLVMALLLRNETDVVGRNVELQRQNRELSIFTENSTQILAAEGDDETLRRLIQLLSRLARMKAAAVVTWEMNPDAPGTVYRFGECIPTDQEILRWVDSAGFAQSAPSRAFVFQNELRKFPLSTAAATQTLIGIQTAEVIYGILLYETEDHLEIIKTGSLNLLTLLVNQTALSLQDQLLRREMRDKTEQLERHAATMSTLVEVSKGLIGATEIDPALTTIAEAIRKSLSYGSVVFALLDPRQQTFVRRAHAGMDDVWEDMQKRHVPADEIERLMNPEFRISNSYFVPHTAVRQSEHDFFLRAEENTHHTPAEYWHQNDVLLVPLTSSEQVLGYLTVRDPQDQLVPTLENVQTLELFATQAVRTLQSAHQHAEIKRLTIIDSLTAAYNHRYFQEVLSREIHRHSRTRSEFTLAMVDIDNFKRINDTFGHPVGDDILKGLVAELTRNQRDSDIVARYGGEEFAIVFTDTTRGAAEEAGNRIRELIENADFLVPSLGRSLRVTVSMGLAVYPRDGETNADLIARADAALYWAKKNGKNQVAIADEVLDTGKAVG